MLSFQQQVNKRDLANICRQYDITKLSIFGSVARGEETEGSDLDILVEFSKRKSLLTLISLERQLSEIFGYQVDLLTEAAISPYLLDDIKRDLQVIYEAQ